ncbi:hypothetical protein K461DRAFT_294110 [Myriangium duriaei CBS 260.36]|uniref:Uncharacterized protein n=1 Tax=Myriangium duriaei CBS 260.36 TaxID=1168546 RepID=A0A9P4J4X5_9PEZI|nr:hypothetical protein K461DRAFT_294110 [Myriangium duriaei CBS 260.36]
MAPSMAEACAGPIIQFTSVRKVNDKISHGLDQFHRQVAAKFLVECEPAGVFETCCQVVPKLIHMMRVASTLSKKGQYSPEQEREEIALWQELDRLGYQCHEFHTEFNNALSTLIKNRTRAPAHTGDSSKQESDEDQDVNVEDHIQRLRTYRDFFSYYQTEEAKHELEEWIRILGHARTVSDARAPGNADIVTTPFSPTSQPCPAQSDESNLILPDPTSPAIVPTESPQPSRYILNISIPVNIRCPSILQPSKRRKAVDEGSAEASSVKLGFWTRVSSKFSCLRPQ